MNIVSDTGTIRGVVVISENFHFGQPTHGYLADKRHQLLSEPYKSFKTCSTTYFVLPYGLVI
ncbi:hypothetical protein BpHYR1_044836 [Brachionus plicatilis]|uniref:Uncharacterized protein n=1 Tax=Brachionus plicatilis TaxID=10195 RepID=A0A3M7RAR5_BRAPC|nr:hypothetical protein BpHYR1_044836 [Brachionus plicatilis]